MKIILRILGLCALSSLTVQMGRAATFYVATNGNDAAAGTNWATAKQSIQAAIDLALPGDAVLVGDGIYSSGGRTVYGGMTNRVAIPGAVSVRSVNGPLVTFIAGAVDYLSLSFGDAAVRCAYVGSNASLSGFTLTGGCTTTNRNGGGAWCEASAVISNCVITACIAYSNGGGAFGGRLMNCTLSGNSALGGGGAFNSLLTDCALMSNVAEQGGGANNCTLTRCTLSGNGWTISASRSSTGAGAFNSTLSNCLLTGNVATYAGGGSYNCNLDHCIIAGNSVNDGALGGGAFGGTLDNCLIYGNDALRNYRGIYDGNGGGAYDATLNNCTVVGNRAGRGGSGTQSCRLNNCIVYSNSFSWYDPISQQGGGAGNDADSIVNYTCTTPLPAGGTGNFTNDPQFVEATNSNFRLSSGSPCINAGNNAYVHGTNDLDANPRIVNCRVDIGAYEYQGSAPVSWARSAYPMSFDNAKDVQLLRRYRDEILRKDAVGNAYVAWLYKNSDAALALVLRSAELRRLAGSIVNKDARQIENALNGQAAVITDSQSILTFCDLVSKEDKGELGTMARNVKKMIQDGMKSGKPVFGIKFAPLPPVRADQPASPQVRRK